MCSFAAVLFVLAAQPNWTTYVPWLLTLATLTVGIFTLRNTIRQWRWTFFTKEWSSLMQMLSNQAEFMDPVKTASYKTAFTADQQQKYDIIARLCIGYLDDLWFLGSEKEMLTWFRGSMRLFGGTHRAWLRDNRLSYDERFYTFLDDWLNKNL